MAGDREKASFLRLFQLIVVLAWILGLWFLCADVGEDPLLGKFLRPDYWWIVEMGVGILILFLISLVYCNPHNRGRRGLGLLLQMGIMIVPLLYLPAAVRSELSPDAAKKRSFSVGRFERAAHNTSLDRTSGSTGTDRKARSEKNQLPEDPSLINLIMESSHYEGKHVTTLGKVCLDDRLPKGTFFCYRLLMVCCAADASPVGVVVHYDKIESVKNGDWVKVEGTVGFTTFQDHRAVKLVAKRVEPTSRPKDPYVWW